MEINWCLYNREPVTTVNHLLNSNCYVTIISCLKFNPKSI